MIWDQIKKIMILNKRIWSEFIKRRKDLIIQDKMWNWLRRNFMWEKDRKCLRLIISNLTLIISLSSQSSIQNWTLDSDQKRPRHLFLVCKISLWNNKVEFLKMSSLSYQLVTNRKLLIDLKTRNPLLKPNGMKW